MGLTLIVLNGPGKGRVFELEGGQPEVIGRAGPKLRLADTETSRRHAEVRFEKDTWIIRDLGSTNGTFVNGRKLTGLTELEEGDQILVGRVLLVVGQITPPTGTSDTAAPSAAAAAVASAAPIEAPPARDEDEDDPFDALARAAASDNSYTPPIPLGAAPAPTLDDEDDDLAPPAPEAPPKKESLLSPAAAAAAADEDDEPFDLSQLDRFALGAKSEAKEGGTAEAEEAAAPPADDERPESGFLAANDDIVRYAEKVVKRERGDDEAFDPFADEDEPLPPPWKGAEEGADADAEGPAEAGALLEEHADIAPPPPPQPQPQAVDESEDEDDAAFAALIGGAAAGEPALDFADEAVDDEALAPLTEEPEPIANAAAAPEAPEEAAAAGVVEEAADDEDPLAALARANQGAHPADAWPDLELDFDAAPSPTKQAEPDEPAPVTAVAHPPVDDDAVTGAIEMSVSDADIELAEDAEAISPRDTPAAPSLAASDDDVRLDDALADNDDRESTAFDDDDDEPGTGLLHHIGVQADPDEQTGGPAAVAAPAAEDDAHDDDLHGELVLEDDEEAALKALAARHDEPFDAAFDDENEQGGEAGVNLTDLVESEPQADEGRTTIINDAVQTHAPYEDRNRYAGAGRGTPTEPVAAEHWVAPERRAALQRKQNAFEADADRAAVEARHAAAVAAVNQERPARRGLIAVLLSMLVIVGVGVSAWYAHRTGAVDLRDYLPGATVEPATPAGNTATAPEVWKPEPAAPIPPAAPPTTGPTAVGRDHAFAPLADVDPPGPAQPPAGWELGSTPMGALSDAPRLLGETVLKDRVSNESAPPPAPAPEPAAAAPNTAAAGATDRKPSDAPPDDAMPMPIPATPGAQAAATPAPEAVTPSPPATPAPSAEAPPPSPQPVAGAAVTPEAPTASPAEPVPAAPAVAEAPAAPPLPGRRIAFVVNASGAVLDSLDHLVAWTNRSIAELSPRDEYTVIFFRAQDAIEVPPVGLRNATDESKTATRRWTDLTEGNIFPSGQSDPVQALQTALRYDVEEIILLSDNSIGRGRTGEGIEEAMAEIDAAVAAHNAASDAPPVRIHTVQFFYQDPRHVLEQLAARHGGTYQFIEANRDSSSGPAPLEALDNLSAAPTVRVRVP